MTGSLSLVLHAHLPYIPLQTGQLDPRECWLLEALLESYLPLTMELTALGELPGRLTLSVSPTLLAMLADSGLDARFREYLAQHRAALADRAGAAADFHRERADAALAIWTESGGRLAERWAQLEREGRIELATSAGTHPVLPLLKSEACRALHIEAAACGFEATFGRRPRVMWLPECGFTPGIDDLLARSGVWASVVEARALGNAHPTAVRGKFAPVVSNNVAFFARDPSTAASVWSRAGGYPGDPSYREFYSDADRGIPLGVKLDRVTGPDVALTDKAAWDPRAAFDRASGHASDFLARVEDDLARARGSMARPHLCAAYDAELFGHWWYEGPRFLAEVFRQASNTGVELVSLSDVLREEPTLQLATPAPSTWGEHGDFSWWVDEATAPLIPLLHTAEERWLARLNNEGPSARLITATRELMLAQASDWPFAVRGVVHAEYAKDRIREHLRRFQAALDGATQADPVLTQLAPAIDAVLEMARGSRTDRGTSGPQSPAATLLHER